jgi:hypothetical protein
MKDVKEYKVSFGFRIETNSTKVNPRTRTQILTIPLMTIIGTILQPIIKALMQYNFPK